jgi:hypothetical protein
MLCKLESSIFPDHILHSQLISPRRSFVLPLLPEHSESLWTLVNCICDRFMPQLSDPRFGPQMWQTPWEIVQR